jgi:hypothetical protein
MTDYHAAILIEAVGLFLAACKRTGSADRTLLYQMLNEAGAGANPILVKLLPLFEFCGTFQGK